MFKLLIWLAGSCGLLYLAWRFATWHLLLQLVVLAALFLWVVGGGLALAYRGRKHARTARDSAADRAAVTPASMRAQHAARFGERDAALIEQMNPGVWEILCNVARSGE